jgi:hypothetical protein
MKVVATVAVAAFALSGCAVKSTLDKKFTPPPTKVTVEATVAVAGASVEGTLTGGFPDTLPVWPGATVTKSKTTKTPQGKSYSAIMTTPDPYADVLAGVGEGLKRAEWKPAVTDASGPDQKVSIIMISNLEADGIVTVSQLPKRPVRIEYVVTPK